eukprot:Mrub_06505.p1 GENE.Mrub_06505~~Mrub_06505.p1  ORF type:complete len:288 (+),score=38.71 Mrub_06505:127-990(+)
MYRKYNSNITDKLKQDKIPIKIKERSKNKYIILVLRATAHVQEAGPQMPKGPSATQTAYGDCARERASVRATRALHPTCRPKTQSESWRSQRRPPSGRAWPRPQRIAPATPSSSSSAAPPRPAETHCASPRRSRSPERPRKRAGRTTPQLQLPSSRSEWPNTSKERPEPAQNELAQINYKFYLMYIQLVIGKFYDNVALNYCLHNPVSSSKIHIIFINLSSNISKFRFKRTHIIKGYGNYKYSVITVQISSIKMNKMLSILNLNQIDQINQNSQNDQGPSQNISNMN